MDGLFPEVRELALPQLPQEVEQEVLLAAAVLAHRQMQEHWGITEGE